MGVDAAAISEIALTTNAAAAAGHAGCHRGGVDNDGQARLGYDFQRLPGRPGGDHRSLRVCDVARR